MTCLYKAIFVMTAVLSLSFNNYVFADSTTERLLIKESGSVVNADYKRIKELQSRLIKYGVDADVESTKRWRRTNIHRAWQELYPGIPLSERNLELIETGRFSKVDEVEIVGRLALCSTGTPTLAELYVGMLLEGDGTYYWPTCTVTLIRPDTVLTAQHCVNNLHGHDLKTYFPFGGVRKIQTQQLFCEEFPDDCLSWVDDLAIAKFEKPYSIPIATSPSIPQLEMARQDSESSTTSGIQAQIAGFGFNDPRLRDNGIKRSGMVVLSDCLDCDKRTNPGDPSDGGRSICFNVALENPDDQQSPILVSNQRGDSGGPMQEINGGYSPSSAMIGLCREIDTTCGEEGKYVNIAHDKYRGFLNGEFCENGPCGVASASSSLAFAEESFGLLAEPIVFFEDGTDQHEYTIKLSEFDLAATGQTENSQQFGLRVTLNHELGRYNPEPNDLDLELPGELEASCERYYGVEECVVRPLPQALTDIQVTVRKVYRNAAYQLTAVAFLDLPPIETPDPAPDEVAGNREE